MALTTCIDCDKQISESATACLSCGSPVKANTVVGKYKGAKKKRSTAAICALLLGGLGIHKFYLGSTGLGIIYLVFCWTFIPAILGLVE